MIAMDTSADPGYQRVETRAGAQSLFDAGLESAQERIRLFDRDGEFYGLSRPSVSERFARLLRLSRQTEVVIVVQRSGYLQRQCPRLLTLLRTHGDRLQLLSVDGQLAEYSRGYVLIDDAVVLRRPHVERSILIRDEDEQEIAAAARLFTEVLDSAMPVIGASTTGL